MQFIKNTGKMFTYKEDEKLIELVRLHPCLHDPNHVHYKDQVEKEIAWREIVSQMKKRGIVLKKRWKNIRDVYVRRVKRIRSGDLPKNQYPLKFDLSFLKFSFQDDSDSSDIKIQSVGSFSDAGDNDAVYNEECMNSDTETDTAPLLQFNTVDNSSAPSTSSKSDVPLPSKFEKEQPPPLVETILSVGNSQSSTQQNGDDFGERASALLGKSSDQNEELLRKIFQQREEDSLDLFFRSVAMSVRNLPPDLIRVAKIRILQLLAELEEIAK